MFYASNNVIKPLTAINKKIKTFQNKLHVDDFLQ
jgi:hypothetical protein